MEPREIEDAILVSVFERSADQQRRGEWMIVGGLGLVGVAVVGFLLAHFSQAGQLTLHAMSTVPMMMAFGLLSGGWALSRGPRRVTLDDEGMQVEQAGGAKQHLWSEIGWATVSTVGIGQNKRLVVYDRSGKKLESLSEAFGDFEELVEAVKLKVADQPDGVSGDIQSRKARKSAIITATFALVMLGVSASVAWMTHEKQRADQLLETVGVEGVATIDRLFVAPNGVTTRVEYTVVNDAGEAASHNAEVEPAYHAALIETNAKTIRVMYVPDEPGISRLLQYEIVDDDLIKSPIGGYGLSGLVTLMCLVFLGAAVMQWKGWDIDLDSKSGKISMKRFGEGE